MEFVEDLFFKLFGSLFFVQTELFFELFFHELVLFQQPSILFLLRYTLQLGLKLILPISPDQHLITRQFSKRRKLNNQGPPGIHPTDRLDYQHGRQRPIVRFGVFDNDFAVLFYGELAPKI